MNVWHKYRNFLRTLKVGLMTKHYIRVEICFMNIAKRKRTRAYCSRCNAWVEVTEARHNESGICPNCLSDITYKAMKKQKYIRDYINGAIMQRVNDGFVLRKFHISRYFNRQESFIISPYEIKKLFLRE